MDTAVEIVMMWNFQEGLAFKFNVLRINNNVLGVYGAYWLFLNRKYQTGFSLWISKFLKLV